ncbi:TIGR02680 family protein [Sporosarcina soli]|uniref:TIGR02680 family protein n=1 Tax=Sporosarcina soli TaxID=334736 RepID=A0ABW0TD83_9BACL
MNNSKWSMNRAGLLNFWYYDDEIFTFSDGKLLLRGTNGSGKSVTMQSFLPVLLDGKKSPDRLDPFGSRARKMEDYLLGEKEVTNRDERTGYLFIEYKKKGMEQYVTTGIGMQAKRNKGIKSWYFLLTDNRRIGQDIDLAIADQGERIPLSAKQLENRIGQGGYVVHSQKEYMDLVNKYIFGFQSNEAYEDLIKLLIQLRSPKLSKDFKPTVIYEILGSALPALTDDELRHLSETIENMDQTQQQLEQLEREFASTGKLVKQYHLYNQFMLAERAGQWQCARERYDEAAGKMENLEAQQLELKRVIESLQMDKSSFEQRLQLAKTEEEQLRSHDVWQLESKLSEKKDAMNTLEKEIERLQIKWDEKRGQHSRIIVERETLQQELQKNKTDVQNALGELELDATESAFIQHTENDAHYQRHREQSIDFTLWLQEAKAHERLLTTLKELVAEEQRLTENHLLLQRQSSDKKQHVDNLLQQQEHLEQWFTEQKQLLTNHVFGWIERHPELQFSDEQIQNIARLLGGLYETNRYDDVREQLLTAINSRVTAVQTNASITKNAIVEIEKIIEQAKNELHHWKTLKMPHPDRADDTNTFRSQLDVHNKAYLPFYAAVEFLDHVTEEQKERLESALKQTGLLDSIITGQQLSPIGDRVIQTNPLVLVPTLADYLRPDVDADSPIAASIVDDVLRSIQLERKGEGFALDADGTYAIGCLIGHAPNEGPSKYIGRSSRKRFQQGKIEECELEIDRLQLERNELDIRLLHFQEQLQQIEEWKKTMPQDDALYEVNDEKHRHSLLLKQEQTALQLLDRQWKEALSELRKVKVQLHGKGNELNIKLTAETIGQALEAASSYLEQLHELDKAHQRGVNARKQIQFLHERIYEKEAELDELKGEQNMKETKRSHTSAEIKSIETQMKLEGIDEIRAHIQQVQQTLKEAEQVIDEIREGLPKKEAELNVCMEKSESAQISAKFWGNMTSEWERIVQTELALRFVEMEETEPLPILSFLSPITEKYDRSKLSEQLTKTFYNEQLQLTEYRMFEYTEETAVPEWLSENWGDYFEPFKNEWVQLQGRRLIQMEYQGQRVNPYFVLTSLENELAEQKGWLDEQDRQLYEDIIVNTVGSILRNRIQRAEKWVREMDKIMASRNNSSGLIFSISWKPLTAESEQELDTKDLVSLLQRNSKFLSEEDLNKITKHFQSRILKAKELIQLRNEGSTLHQVLKEVLDYRKWFTFILSYKKENEPKRELTNNAFFRFSGGEKAMAMYIPLFTAAYSRYKEAGEMAPYIISLDEAFAGVDENNIRDMFEVVEQLGFDYIMNSQALWGDYDTIPQLSICELIRPKNADSVAVIRYEWDGKQRKLVLDEDPIEELIPND